MLTFLVIFVVVGAMAEILWHPIKAAQVLMWIIAVPLAIVFWLAVWSISCPGPAQRLARALNETPVEEVVVLSFEEFDQEMGKLHWWWHANTEHRRRDAEYQSEFQLNLDMSILYEDYTGCEDRPQVMCIVLYWEKLVREYQKSHPDYHSPLDGVEFLKPY